MRDKEFDQLFRDQLKDAEIQPSSGLWNKIEAEMEPKKKASSPVFWMAAAAALVLMAAGLLFTKTEKIQLQALAPLAENLPVTAQEQPAGELDSEGPAEVETYTGTPLVIAPSIEVDYPVERAPSRKNTIKTSAAVQPKPAPVRLDDVKIAAAEPVSKNDGWVSDTHIIASTDASHNLPDEVINENDQAEKKGIRNVGDLVNYVVEKVDKREQKFLKFNTDDDDNSSLVAINIGFIKFNPKRSK